MSRDKTQSGITLIALVITIIVMLILVGVTVSIAINGGLFGMAKKAKSQTEEARDVEQELANGRILVGDTWYDSMSDYVNGNRSKDQSEGGTYFTAEKNEDGILTENATYKSGGYTATIPKGFKVSEGEGEYYIPTGLVIQDAEGNEFVWVPVTYTATGELDDHGLDSGFLAVFYRSDWSENKRGTKYDNSSNSNYAEPYKDGYDGEDDDYYEMMKSVQENGGFYIGRYEAGSGEEIPRTENSGDTKMVVKRDQYPYVYVEWGNSMNNFEDEVVFDDKEDGHGAVYLSKHMYDGKDVGVISTLCYGVEWDAMLDFIKDNDHDVSNSTKWGNYRDNDWILTRAQAKYSEFLGITWKDISGTEKSKNNSTRMWLTTGASDSFKSKNIYDVAGNCWEWTMEANSMLTRVLRGGNLNDSGFTYPASYRYDRSPNEANNVRSFRPALYIKN